MITFIIDLSTDTTVVKYHASSDNTWTKLDDLTHYHGYFEGFVSGGLDVQVFTHTKKNGWSRRFFSSIFESDQKEAYEKFLANLPLPEMKKSTKRAGDPAR